MISRDLLKRTPVRLAGAFTLLFALTVVALVAVLYLTLGAELESHIRKRVEETSDTLLAIDAEHGFDALAVVVADEAKSVRDFDSIFLLRREDGAFQAGNVQNVKVFAGWDILDRAWLPMVAEQGRSRRPLLFDLETRLQRIPAGWPKRSRDPRGAAHPAARPELGSPDDGAARHRFGDVSGASRTAEDRRVCDDLVQGRATATSPTACR